MVILAFQVLKWRKFSGNSTKPSKIKLTTMINVLYVVVYYLSDDINNFSYQ